jgi:hypothetical protein
MISITIGLPIDWNNAGAGGGPAPPANGIIANGGQFLATDNGTFIIWG